MHQSASSFSSSASFASQSDETAFLHLDQAQTANGLALTEMATEQTDPQSGRILSARMTWAKTGRAPSRGPGGKLGVLIPTLNCRDQLQAQVEAMAKWLDLVDEIVVIDGDSTDGTVEYLAQAIRHPRLRIVRHPRGLWQSWNAGLALMSTEYVLIATVGDVMGREGAMHLLEVAQQTGADIVLSPPQFQSHDTAAPPPEAWPIHEWISRAQFAGPQLVPHDELMRLAFWFAAWSQSLLGSSASNLYRTRLFQEHPFPADTHSAGDVAWVLRNMRHAQVAITPTVCARFTWHPAARVSGDLAIMWRHACAGAGMAVPFEVFFEKQRVLNNQERAYFSRLGEIQRRWGLAWRLHPHAWGYGMRRSQFQQAKAGMGLDAGISDCFKTYARETLVAANALQLLEGETLAEISKIKIARFNRKERTPFGGTSVVP